VKPGKIRKTIRARLSTFDTAMVVFSLVVGIGIFRTTAIVAGAQRHFLCSWHAWIAGGSSLDRRLTFAGDRVADIRGRRVLPRASPTAIIRRWHSCCIGRSRDAGRRRGRRRVFIVPTPHAVLLPPPWRTPKRRSFLAFATMLMLLVLNYRGVKAGCARPESTVRSVKIVMERGS